jgi:hypothetical protein
VYHVRVGLYYSLDVDFRSISVASICRFDFRFDCDYWIRYIIWFDSVDFVFRWFRISDPKFLLDVCLVFRKPKRTHWWFLQQLGNLSLNSQWFSTIFMSAHKSSVPSPRLRGPPIIIINMLRSYAMLSQATLSHGPPPPSGRLSAHMRTGPNHDNNPGRKIKNIIMSSAEFI